MQNLNVNITPDNYPQSLYYSQNDVGREFKINITDFTIPTGATVKIQATKPSGFGFSVAGTVSGNSVAFTTTEAMTDEAGRFPAELQITYNDDVIGTANFMMIGEANPHPEGTINGQIDQVSPELNVFIKQTIDDWLDEHPEATTTVEDGSLTEAKFTESLKLKTIKDYVTPEMFGAVGDGTTDDTQSFVLAIASGKIIKLLSGKNYKVTQTLSLTEGCSIIGDITSTIFTSAEVAFHLTSKCVLEGFRIWANNGCKTVFLVNDESGSGNMRIYLNNLTGWTDSSMVAEYTVLDIHSVTGGLYGINVNGGYYACVDTSVISYFARIYALNTAWVSSCKFDGVYTHNFRWHYFFAQSEALMGAQYSTASEGGHIISNCVAQSAKKTEVAECFLYTTGKLELFLNNNMMWDFGKGLSRSILVNSNLYDNGSRIYADNNVLFGQTVSVYDSGSYIKDPYTWQHMNTIFGGYGSSLSPKVTPSMMLVPVMNDANTAARLIYNSIALPDTSRLMFALLTRYGVYNISVSRSKVIVPADFPKGNYRFYISSDYKKVYMGGDDLTSYDSLIIYPIMIPGAISYAYGNSFGNRATSRALSGNEYGKPISTIFLNSLPEGLTELPYYTRPLPVIGEDGNRYAIKVDTNGNVVASRYSLVNELA